ncbi:MAG TPA: cupin domain-containing protein [Ilumatobacter sp.]|nr:cupin domain-containing protein [Ilumatobacter sp.]
MTSADGSPRVVAAPFIDETKSAVRVIRLGPGQTTTIHATATSELMIFIVDGSAELTVEDTTVELDAGSLHRVRGDEELRATNTSTAGVTALALLATAFQDHST